MAYDYLGLCNDVAVRLNETQLTTSNFSTATGFYSAIKEAVNSSIRHINQSHFSWPFNHNSEEQTLTAGVVRYNIPDEAKYVDFDTFRVRRDDTLDLGETRRLKQLSYDEYVDRFIQHEDQPIDEGGVPEYVFRAQNNEFGVVPQPDKAYQVDFEYFNFPVDLVLNSDVPSIPERFRFVITDGAMYYAYMFRDNLEMASVSQRKFNEGVKQMRVLLVNENVYMRAV
tara:strand:+ start:1646 stop:2323 length:678 start_codon:yes stop_codon:yes gene_type:complete